MPSLFINLLKIENFLFIISILIVIISFWGIVFNISLSIGIIFSIIIFLSILFYFNGVKIKQWIINVLSIIFLILPFLNFSIDDIILPSVEALALITALRFLGNKTSREYFQIYLMAMLLLSASTIFSVSWIFLVRFALVFILCLFSILLITYLKETSQNYTEKGVLKGLLKYTIIIIILSVPMSIVFFIFLPRTPYPLLNIGLASAKTGFSSTVNLGSISTIEEDKSVVMRVKMDKIDFNQLYWRMITFDNFDGKKWTREEIFTHGDEKIIGKRIRYSVFFEPSYENYLPVLDFPLNVYLQNLILEYPGVYKTKNPIQKPLKYIGESSINYEYYEEQPNKKYLQLPDNITNRFKALTEEITSKAAGKEEVINNVIDFLKNYEYSLKYLPQGNNPVEDFVFNAKKGNCEYFATTMALMLRIKGIHSRVVGGFRGGSYNPFGAYYLIRASDAHLWVEAWSNGVWRRYDPSGSRVVRYNEPVVLNFLDYIWNNFVINYDLTTQLKLVNTIKSPKFHFEKKYLFPLSICLIIIISIYTLRIYKINRSPLKRFLKIMNKGGYERKNNEGLEEFIINISDSKIRDLAAKFIDFYSEIYFKDKKFRKIDIRQLNSILEELNANIKSRRGKNTTNN